MNPQLDRSPRVGGGVSGLAVINILLGIWFFISPWVFGVFHNRNAWNAWIVGAVIVLFAAFRAASPAGLRLWSWFNIALGVWVFASPWIFSYVADTGRMVNSLCVGVLVFLLAVTAWAQPTTMVPHHQ